ncbi:MAG: aldehyde dehydrogenase family protein [Azospirillaceae bacterium]
MPDTAMPARLPAFIGGETRRLDGPAVELKRPQDGSVGGHLVEAGAAGVAKAVADARRAFDVHRRATSRDRSEWLKAAAAGLRERAGPIAEAVSADIGKPIRAARFETGRGADLLEACAAAALDIHGDVVPVDSAPAGAGLFGFTRRVPYGVVGAITPFNAPVNLVLQKVGPAIAAGNAVVVKPAPPGTAVALALAEAMADAGLPAGLFDVVTGGRETALALAADPGVDAVTFTGGTEAGDALVRAAGAKKFAAELGSNAANIVLADADVATAAKKIAGAAFEASGQQCISAQRVIVARPVFDAFLEAFEAAARAMRVGPIDDPDTDLGPLVSAGAADRVMAMVQDALDRGARAILEPRRTDCVVTPGILADVPRDARLWREEVFGPIAVLTPAGDAEEALALANDSEFGLQGAVFTASLDTAMRFSEAFEVGSLWVNEASRFRLDMYPFGGVKRSGFGREGVRHAVEELTQAKFTGVRLGGGA